MRWGEMREVEMEWGDVVWAVCASQNLVALLRFACWSSMRELREGFEQSGQHARVPLGMCDGSSGRESKRRDGFCLSLLLSAACVLRSGVGHRNACTLV